ncbi:hypothetical protein C8R42DRAFT_645684 [Lentinula raphanica]|nr:hypothetical protein C8R42DRAFT_645684 [Lentinula raphanica]
MQRTTISQTLIRDRDGWFILMDVEERSPVNHQESYPSSLVTGWRDNNNKAVESEDEVDDSNYSGNRSDTDTESQISINLSYPSSSNIYHPETQALTARLENLTLPDLQDSTMATDSANGRTGTLGETTTQELKQDVDESITAGPNTPKISASIPLVDDSLCVSEAHIGGEVVNVFTNTYPNTTKITRSRSVEEVTRSSSVEAIMLPQTDVKVISELTDTNTARITESQSGEEVSTSSSVEAPMLPQTELEVKETSDSAGSGARISISSHDTCNPEPQVMPRSYVVLGHLNRFGELIMGAVIYLLFIIRVFGKIWAMFQSQSLVSGLGILSLSIMLLVLLRLRVHEQIREQLLVDQVLVQSTHSYEDDQTALSSAIAGIQAKRGLFVPINGAETEIVDLKSVYATDLVLSHSFISLPIPLGIFYPNSLSSLVGQSHCYPNCFVSTPCTILQMPPSELPHSITNAQEVANTQLYSASPVTNHRNRDTSSSLQSTESGRVLLGFPRSITNPREVASTSLYSASERVTNYRNCNDFPLPRSTESGQVLLGLPRSMNNAREVATTPSDSASCVINHDNPLPRSTESGRVLFGLPRSIINAPKAANTPSYSASESVTNHRVRDNSSLPRPTESARVLLELIRSIDEAQSEGTTSSRTLETRSSSAIATAGSPSTDFGSNSSDSTRGRIVPSQMPPSHFVTNACGVANMPLFSTSRDIDRFSSDLHNSSSRRSTAAGHCLQELIHSLDDDEGVTQVRASGNRSSFAITITRSSQSASAIATTGRSSTGFTSRSNVPTHGQVVTSQISPSHPVTNARSVANMPLLSASRVTDHCNRDHPSSDNINNSSLRRSTAAGRLLLELIRSLDEEGATQAGGGSSSTGTTTDSEVIADASNRGQIASGADGSSLDANDEVILLETVGEFEWPTKFGSPELTIPFPSNLSGSIPLLPALYWG